MPNWPDYPDHVRELLEPDEARCPDAPPLDASPDAAGDAWARALGIYRRGATQGVLVGATSGAPVPFTLSPTKA